MVCRGLNMERKHICARHIVAFEMTFDLRFKRAFVQLSCFGELEDTRTPFSELNTVINDE